MSTISDLVETGGVTAGTYQWKAVPTMYSVIIDFADALASKGSALAADDIIECIRFPANSMILMAGIQTVAVDDATTLTLHLGITGGDIDGFVASYDQAAASAGAYATSLYDPTEVQVFYATADSLDVELVTLTGTLTVGKIRVFALIVDMAGTPMPGIAQLRS